MTHFRARTPQDAIALVPIFIGFHPTDSLVALTFSDRGGVHLRFDLDELTSTTTGDDPAKLLGNQIGILAYTDDPDRAAEATAALLARIPDSTTLSTVICVDPTARTWRPWDGTGYTADPTPYQIDDHPFTLQALFEGRSIHPSRSALVDDLTGDPQEAAEHLSDAYAWIETQLGSHDPNWVPNQARWAHDRLTDWAATGVPATPDQVALLGVSLQFREIFDAALAALEVGNPGRMAATLSDLAARTPVEVAAPVRCLAAAATIRSGTGTAARIHLDLARDADPDYSLIDEIEQLLLTVSAGLSRDS